MHLISQKLENRVRFFLMATHPVSIYARYSYAHILPSMFLFFKRSYVLPKSLCRVNKKCFTWKLLRTQIMLVTEKVFCDNKNHYATPKERPMSTKYV